MARRRRKISQATDEVDMTALIDIIFLIIIFFILAGKITSDLRPEKITVPPTKTARDMELPPGWQKVVINVRGDTQTSRIRGKPPFHEIMIGDSAVWRGNGYSDFGSYQKLRQFLDRVYDAADKYDDPNGTGIRLPMVAVEIRADAETEYRVVQEVQQVMSDTVDPFPDANGKHMLPKKHDSPADMKSFVDIRFTSKKPEP